MIEHPEAVYLAASSDDRVHIESSSLWMLCQTFKRARPGEYVIYLVHPAPWSRLSTPELESRLWGMAIVDDQGVDLREHGPNRKLKRRILITPPKRPSTGRVE